MELESSSGAVIPVTITRVKSVETIPFWVEYEVRELPESANCLWTLELPLNAASPIIQEMNGASARFVSSSNAKDHLALLHVTIDATTYEWEGTIDFPLHSQTEILLDSAAYGVQDAESVIWSAHNWTPDDGVTFPIADPALASTTMASEWPNVLYVSCLIEDEEGQATENETEALVYWRDGPPFELRGTTANLNDPLPTKYSLFEIVDQEIPLLEDLGVNLIVHIHREYFDAPDANGDFDIHALYAAIWPPDPNGFTPTLNNLEYYFRRMHEAGFRIHTQILSRNYPTIGGDYHSSGWGSEAGFMGTAGWLATYHDHFERTVSFFAGLKDDEGNNVVDSMTLSAEKGWLEDRGGQTIRDFQRDLLEEIRDPSPDNPMYFTGSISYAHSYYQNVERASSVPLGPTLLAPRSAASTGKASTDWRRHSIRPSRSHTMRRFRILSMRWYGRSISI